MIKQEYDYITSSFMNDYTFISLLLHNWYHVNNPMIFDILGNYWGFEHLQRLIHATIWSYRIYITSIATYTIIFSTQKAIIRL